MLNAKKQKLTQSDLAEKVGVNKSTICSFETGQRTINSETLSKILTELNLKIVPKKNLKI
ncbi:MAG: helix-turn-helix domain-containing protein [Dysgonomonas sp.]